MDGGLLSLKWNNHRSTFFHVLSSVRKKDRYSDATIACDGKFYKVHKLVMSTCSEYFEQMFEQTDCKNPVIVLKDIKSEELESLLSYMYVGEVNVVQEKLAGLIKAAECLKIKGLAVPDEEPQSSKPSNREKRSADSNASSEPKRRKEEVRQSYNNISSEERRKSSDNSRYRNSSNNSSTVENTQVGGESNDSLVSSNQNAVPVKEEANAVQYSDPPPEVTLDDPQEVVKQEPNDMDAVYIDDSNSASESKDMLMDNFDDGDGQQHFMDELLGQNSDQTNMSGVGNFNDGGEGSAGGSQQHMDEPMENWLSSRGAWVVPHGLSAQGLGAPMAYPGVTGDSGANAASVYRCQMCPYTTKDGPNMRRHQRIHTLEKPYHCTFCSYTSAYSHNLKSHIQRNHLVTS